MKQFFSALIRRKKIVIPLAVIIALVIFFIGTRPTSADQVELHAVQRQDIKQALSATGSVDSNNMVNLNFIAGGKLVYLGVKKGDMVVAGQTIATLDQRSMQKNLEMSLRSYSQQRNAFDQTRVDKNAPTPKDAVNDTIKRILEDNQYDLDKAVISVELQALAKEQSVLVSPIGGIVVKSDVTAAGVNVSPTTSFTIADPNSMVFKMDIDEADIGKIHEGQPMSAVIDAFPDETQDLTVSSIDFSTHATATGGNAFAVQASLPFQSSFRYRIGMTGDAEVLLHEKRDVLSVPIASIIDDKYVYIRTQKGFEKREIEMGLSNDTDVEVTSGLQEGDKIAVDPTVAEKANDKKFGIF